MGFILCVMQDISMYRYLWEPSQATLDPLASSPRQPLAPSEGFPSAYKDPSGITVGPSLMLLLLWVFHLFP